MGGVPLKGRADRVRVHPFPVLLGCRTPPLQLTHAPAHITPPPIFFVGVFIVVVTSNTTALEDRSVLVQNPARVGNMHHGAHGQTTELGQDGSQSLRGPRPTPLSRRVADDRGRLEGKDGGAKVVQKVEQGRGGGVVVLGCDANVGVGRLENVVQFLQRGRDLGRCVGEMRLVEERQIDVSRIDHCDDVSARFEGGGDVRCDARAEHGPGWSGLAGGAGNDGNVQSGGCSRSDTCCCAAAEGERKEGASAEKHGARCEERAGAVLPKVSAGTSSAKPRPQCWHNCHAIVLASWRSSAAAWLLLLVCSLPLLFSRQTPNEQGGARSELLLCSVCEGTLQVGTTFPLRSGAASHYFFLRFVARGHSLVRHNAVPFICLDIQSSPKFSNLLESGLQRYSPRETGLMIRFLPL